MLSNTIVSFSEAYTTIKEQLSASLEIDQKHLNEISLEDVRIAESAKENINDIIADMLVDSGQNMEAAAIKSAEKGKDILPCVSFWIEKTRDLVVFICAENQSEAIIVPEDGWVVRSDRTIH